LQPKVRRSFSDEEGSSEDLLELSDVDSESSDIRCGLPAAFLPPVLGLHPDRLLRLPGPVL
ncbi:CHFR isoform 17, partial [Pan troglodytes]